MVELIVELRVRGTEAESTNEIVSVLCLKITDQRSMAGPAPIRRLNHRDRFAGPVHCSGWLSSMSRSGRMSHC
jgi:hypothetical protein